MACSCLRREALLIKRGMSLYTHSIRADEESGVRALFAVRRCQVNHFATLHPRYVWLFGGIRKENMLLRAKHTPNANEKCVLVMQIGASRINALLISVHPIKSLPMSSGHTKRWTRDSVS